MEIYILLTKFFLLVQKKGNWKIEYCKIPENKPGLHVKAPPNIIPPNR